MQKKNGFTLVELLIVLGILAIVATLAAVAVGAARSKQRDATRISNVRQLQSALEDYFNETNSYPSGTRLALGDASLSACLGSSGFQGDCSGDRSVIMRVVLGTYQKGLEGLVACGEPSRNAFCYLQRLEGVDYSIEFELENGLPPAGLVSGINCATPDGMKGGSCPAM